MKKIKEIFQKIPKNFYIFLAIILVGVFLRTYHFHDWLTFENDQVRDAILVGNVIDGKTNWPLLGPTMRKSENQQGELFRLGSIYYHFQIISAKIFGNVPDKMAYPDLLFSVLSIPLFYFFLKKYFGSNLSLVLLGLYVISFYIIQYSRFAWNPNPIPFFVILFLLSAYELLIAKESAHWVWFVLFGIAFGVGIQLHAVILVIFPLFSIFTLWQLRKKIKIVWKKIILVLIIILFLNASQIISEWKNNFDNTKIFFNSSLVNDSKEEVGFLENMGEDLDCHIEANAYILSSIGSDECKFSFVKLLKSEKSKKFQKEIREISFWIITFLMLIFSILGYAFLIFLFRKEKTEKRIFLQILIFYSILSFIVMFPIIDEKIAKFRYFNHIFFMPSVFLGFFSEYLIKRKKRVFLVIAIFLFGILFLTNLNSIKIFARELSSRERSDIHGAILGEMELMVKYIMKNSDGQKEAYLVGDDLYVAHFFQPFSYIAKKNDFNIFKVKNSNEISSQKALFYLAEKIKSKDGMLSDRKIEKCETLGKIVICKLKNN